MKLLTPLLPLIVSLALLGTGCKTTEVSTPSLSNATTPSTAPVDTTPASIPEPSSTPPSGTKIEGTPVVFTALGLDPTNKKYGLFTVQMVTDKKVSQVDIAFKSYDGSGAIVRDTNFGWQNIVNGEQLPIEQGKTYRASYVAGSGSEKTEARMTRVVFTDGTDWSTE